MFTVFSWIAPILPDETHAGAPYGVGLAVGNLMGMLLATIVLLSLLAATMQNAVPVAPLIFLWGITSFAVADAGGERGR